MNRWSRKTYLLLAIALIALTNAVALGGVAWNRSGEPESQISLGMRELAVAGGDFGSENSGLSLRLLWRTPVAEGDDALRWNRGGGTPPWLDEAAMKALGFAPPPADPETGHSRQAEREVLLVLEFDGPAWQRQREQVRKATDERIARASALTDEKQKQRELTEARNWRQREETESSRLFAVDAGLDADKLRRRHPDRARTLIVRGLVSAHYERKKNATVLRGYLREIRKDVINVPYDYRRTLTAGDRHSPRDNAREALKDSEITIAFGRRLEPWLVRIDKPGTH